MPSWNIHLAVAKQVNKKYKLEKNSFYLGNLIADVNFNTNLERKVTHYDTLVCKECPKELLPNIKEFLKNYKKDIKTSTLLLGYYSHLLTDYFYNKYIFKNCWVQNNNQEIIGVKLNNGKIKQTNESKILKYYKHQDLENYGKYLFNNNYVELPNKFNNIEDLDLLKDNFFKYEDIEKRIIYLNSEFKKNSKYSLKEKIFGIKYKMLTKEKLDELYNECIKFIIKNIDNLFKEFVW